MKILLEVSFHANAQDPNPISPPEFPILLLHVVDKVGPDAMVLMLNLQTPKFKIVEIFAMLHIPQYSIVTKI